MEYAGGSSVSQVVATGPDEAMAKWAERLRNGEHFALTPAQAYALSRELDETDGFDECVAIENVDNVWYTSELINDGLADFNIVETVTPAGGPSVESSPSAEPSHGGPLDHIH